MNDQPLISVIVPVYNVADYLDQCLQSIVDQTYRQLEIIVVDDGSTDDSGTLCDRWAERDERIRVIHQPNGGLSAARNTALDVMQGELVMMVDSDDVLHPDCTSVLLKAMRDYTADIAIGDYQPFYDGQAIFNDQTSSEGAPAIYNQHEAILAILYQNGLTHSAWGRLYKSSLFDGIRYPVGKFYEDFAIIYPLLLKCKTIVKLDRKIYGYRQREKSILQTFSPRRAAVLDIGEQLEQETLANDKQYTRAARSRLLSAYFNILLLCNQDKKDDHKTLQDRCWKGIKRLRFDCLMDGNVRLKNKVGILASYMGRWFLCSVIGRNYQPKA